MAGPCSLPHGGRVEWSRHNEIMCEVHSYFRDGFILSRCDDASVDKNTCRMVTYRMWLADRKRLRTGKTR